MKYFTKFFRTIVLILLTPFIVAYRISGAVIGEIVCIIIELIELLKDTWKL